MSRRLKLIIQKLGLAITLLPSVLLIFGCFFIFLADNLVSFIFTLIIPTLLVLNLIFGIYWLFKKKKAFLLSFFGVILYFLCFDSFLQLNLPVASNFNKTSLKLDALSILSFNTNGFKHDYDENDYDERKFDTDDPIVNFINNTNPDIFCIQEFSAIKYKYFGNYPYWFKTNIFTFNKSVMAIFSKYPIIDKGYITFPNSSNGAMYVDLTFNEEIIRVYNLHLESFKVPKNFHYYSEPTSFNFLRSRIGKAEKIRKEQAVLIKEHIDKFKGKVIISGDFNSTQFSSSYNTLKDSRKDTFIEAGSGFGATYPLFNYPFRLDYILVDNRFEVFSHENFDLKISDHEPILTRLLIVD